MGQQGRDAGYKKRFKEKLIIKLWGLGGGGGVRGRGNKEGENEPFPRKINKPQILRFLCISAWKKGGLRDLQRSYLWRHHANRRQGKDWESSELGYFGHFFMLLVQRGERRGHATSL